MCRMSVFLPTFTDRVSHYIITFSDYSYQKKKYSELQRKFMSGRQRYKSIKHRKKYKKQ